MVIIFKYYISRTFSIKKILFEIRDVYLDIVPKGSAAQQAADCNIIRHIRMGFIFGINKATDTNSDFCTLRRDVFIH